MESIRNHRKRLNDLFCPTPQWEGNWWLLVRENNGLHAYFSSTLESNDWTPHNGNPIWAHPKRSRPAGRPIVRDDYIVMYYQESVEEYGDKVVAYKITDLTKNSFEQAEFPQSPIIEESGYGWNKDRMHHTDPWYIGEGKGWIVAVDGENNDLREWSIGMNHIPELREGASITVHAEIDDDESSQTWEIAWNDPNDPGAISSGTTAPFTQFSAVHVYMDDGTLSPVLTITDPSNNIDTHTYNIPIFDLEPTADFTWSPESQEEGQAVQFKDVSTSNPDTIVSWDWNFGGFGISTEQHPTFAFQDNGVYLIELTITDEDGSIDAVSHTVTITDRGPIAEFSWLPEPCVIVIDLGPGCNLISIGVMLDELGEKYSASELAYAINTQAGEDVIKYVIRFNPQSGYFEEYVVTTIV